MAENPANSDSLSTLIDHTMEGIEEGNAKRRLNHNHDPRPHHARLVDTLNSPLESGAPVIVNLISEPQSFDRLSLLEKKHFINGLINTIGQVKDGTKWTRHGQLYIYPTSNRQKKQLLELKAVKEFQISCNLAKSEINVKGVIYNVPINNSDADLLELVLSQGVTHVHRFQTGPEESKTPLTTVALTFNTQTLPREIVIAHEIFRVKKYIPRPSQCRKCWSLQHQEDTCKVSPICKYCSQQHPPTPVCTNAPKCPTCHKSDHAAGTFACPLFANKQNVIRFAYESNIPISEAGKLLDRNNVTQTKPIHLPVFEKENPEILALRREVQNLKQQIEKILQSPPITDLSERVTALETEVVQIKEQIEPLLTLPASVEKSNQEMKKGFSETQDQLAQLTALIQRSLSVQPSQPVQANRPPPKPNSNTTINTSTPSSKK
jgi:hypothetical protein